MHVCMQVEATVLLTPVSFPAHAPLASLPLTGDLVEVRLCQGAQPCRSVNDEDGSLAGTTGTTGILLFESLF